MMYLLIMIHWHCYLMIVSSQISSTIGPILRDEDVGLHNVHLSVHLLLATLTEQQRIHQSVYNMLVGPNNRKPCT